MAELPAPTITVRSTEIIDSAIAHVRRTRAALGFLDPESGESYGTRSYYIRAIIERFIANNSAIVWTGLAAISYALKGQILAQSALSLATIDSRVEVCIDQQARAVITARTRLAIIGRHARLEKEAAVALNNSGFIAASISLQNRAALAAVSSTNRAIAYLQPVTDTNTTIMETLHLHVEDLNAQVMSTGIPENLSTGGSGLLDVNAASLRLSSQQLKERSRDFALEHRSAISENTPVKVARTHGQHFTAAFDSLLARFEYNQNILLLRIGTRISELAEGLANAAATLTESDIAAASVLH